MTSARHSTPLAGVAIAIVAIPCVAVLYVLCFLAAAVGTVWFGGVEAMRRAGEENVQTSA